MYRKKTIELATKARELDPYFKYANSKKLFGEFSDELNEVKEEFNLENNEEIEKELGDVFWNFNLLINKLEEEGKINIENMYLNIYKKMSTRKSFLLENREVTENEAKQIWNKAKKEEGYSDDRLWDNNRTYLHK